MAKVSDTYPPFEDLSSRQYLLAIDEYRHKFADKQYSLVSLPNGDVGIKAKVIVDAGSDSLLENREPIVIGLQSCDLEACNPYVFPDRTNFPFDSFPHINYPKDSLPATLCLSRENFEEWYVEHTFGEFLDLISKWFNDAVSGNLIKTSEGDFYEPFRPHVGGDLFMRVPYEDKHIETATANTTIYYPIHKIGDLEGFYKGNVLNSNFNDCYGIGMLFVRPCSIVCDKWFVRYPQTIDELMRFIVEHGFNFDIPKLCQTMKENNCNPEIFVLQFAFLRPTIVLGKHTRVDYLTFSIKASDLTSSNFQGAVKEVSMIDALVPDFANFLSATKMSVAAKKILFLGCGAIGSKLIYHLYRCGICELTICDNDFMQPHNVCRHAVTSSGLFKYKVDLIINDLRSMYPMMPCPVKTVSEDILQWLPKTDLSAYDIIIDATASASVIRCIDKLRDKITVPIVHYSLSDGGNIGHVYINKSRTTLVADFYMLLVAQAINNDDISDWLFHEKEYSLDYVRVGEGCHSNTMILSDDVISTHTSIASRVIREIDNICGNQAFFSFIGDGFPGETYSDVFHVDSLISIQCSNAPDWEVRITESLLKTIRLKAKTASPKETGGYLMGAIEEKHKRIYILHTFVPKASYHSRSRLRLSTNGWKQEYNKVCKRTASILQYLGDWHSHPQGSLEMSVTDVLTCYEIKTEEINSKYGICLISNTHETRAYILTDEMTIVIAKQENVQ